MTIDELIGNVEKANERLEQLRGFLDVDSRLEALAELEQVMTAGDFWNNQEEAQKTVAKVKAVKNVLDPYKKLQSKVEDFAVMAELVEMEPDEELLAEADDSWAELEAELDKMELFSFLSGKTDRNDAILTVHAGAGGTESCDWAGMLYRMYTRWAERHNFTIELVDYQSGDEAGVKSATIIIRGEYAAGYLKSEGGVHRLVRISPFDSNNRRHTSFASIDVTAELNDDIEIDIDPSDLRIDTFRASGAGGQHVNTTDSAVRITHVPTGIFVACQSQRSQHKNKATAMKLLKSRLYEAEERKRAEEAGSGAPKADNAFGSQIRSYVLHPYQMVKDLRTSVETSNTGAVLDGDLDRFIDAFLRSGELNK